MSFDTFLGNFDLQIIKEGVGAESSGDDGDREIGSENVLSGTVCFEGRLL